MATKAKTTVNPIQMAYAKAKAAHKAAQAESLRRHARINDMEDHAAWAELSVQIDDELNMGALLGALVEAENALLAWGHEQIKTHPQYAAERANMELVFTKGVTHFKIRPQIIDLCFRLAV